MKPGERLLALIFSSFLLLLWLGFLFHQDERFAGSLTGGLLAVSGSFFLLIPLIYSVIKRVPFIKRFTTRRISFSTLLTIHIYSGFLGAILVLLHTGHKFHGLLATLLTAFLLIVVFSGYMGRYLLTRISKEVQEKRQMLSSLESQYSTKLNELRDRPEELKALRPFTGFISRIFAPIFLHKSQAQGAIQRATDIIQISESMADVEYAISTHDLFKRLFSYWLKIHIALSLIFYFLLVLHILGVYHFGLRWF